jgi:hypothetical protein
MTTTHGSRRRIVLALPAAVLAAAFFGGTAGATVPAPSAPSPTVAPAPISPDAQGFIMSDGRICNPRWGC